MLFLLFTALFAGHASASPLVLLDPGHEPSRPGAIATCGKEEMAYNDELAAAIAAAVGAGKEFRVMLTRSPGKEVLVSGDGASFLAPEHRANWAENPRLYERASLANRLGAAAFISVHHDSAAAQYQEPVAGLCSGRDGKRLTAEFRRKGLRTGFSLFVYQGANDALARASLRLARAIGAEFRAMGRSVSTHHGEAIDCGSCRLLDAKNGVYHKNLAILRASEVPAVLIEAGVIVDVADERAVAQPKFKRAAAAAIRRALEKASAN